MSLMYSMIILMAAQARSATIAELIAERKSTMSRADAAIASNPEWSQPGAHTLFVSTDAGFQGSDLPSGSLGSLMVAQSIDFLRTPNYQILRDIKSSNIMVYDNYRGGDPNPEIHCRFGTGEALAVQQIKADNGWLYILNKPIEPPRLADVAIRSIRSRSGEAANKFVDLVQAAGMTAYFDSFKDVTMWIPINSALDKFEQNKYTADQLKAIILYHITPGIRYSTGFDGGPISTVLEGQSINVAVGSDALTLNRNSIVDLADTFATSGVIHLITEVLVPQQFPAVTIPATPSTTTSTGGKSPIPTGGTPQKTAASAGSTLEGVIIGSVIRFLAYIVF